MEKINIQQAEDEKVIVKKGTLKCKEEMLRKMEIREVFQTINSQYLLQLDIQRRVDRKNWVCSYSKGQ